ncbi:hypothetical protein [Coralliovum pocilloporae]|uniref:hypothetical protein n=1 Tax=Coralliovum pocilloporae TaxID=3066369 RepID=UPI00330787D6
MMKRLLHPRYLMMWLWLIVPIVLFMIYLLAGLPHMIIEYQYRAHNGRHYDPFAERTYFTCTYGGPYGFKTRPAINGKCAWFRFFKEQGQ